jgi:hypothetical protein
MATSRNRTKTYKVDFFVVTRGGERDHTILHDLFTDACEGNGYTEARPLDPGEEEKYQVRSITRAGRGGRFFKGVFGRCRFGETPLQGTEHGTETDVKLKPGHGLVAKNYFLFHSNRNLLVYQRNSSGSHYSRFQAYVNRATGDSLTFEPILTRDSYKRLIRGGEAKQIDVSFPQPKDASIYTDAFIHDAVKLLNRTHGIRARIRISVGRAHQTLDSRIKDAVVALARSGLARVARVRLEDADEPIDLIADRIVGSITVPLQENGRPSSEDIYAALGKAEDDRSDDIRSFFGA